MTKTTGRIVFTGTAHWWQIVERSGEIELGDSFGGDWETAAAVAGIDTDDHESWVARVWAVADRHDAIQIGDFACCQGIGSEVTFVRLS